MGKAVIKGAGYSLFHTPEMLIHLGATQATERVVNPDSDYLKNLTSNLRTFEEVINYLPNQVYIGNNRPEDLKAVKGIYLHEKVKGSRYGKFGEIMPENEFLLHVMIADAFGLVMLEEKFLEDAIKAYSKHPLKTDEEIAKVQGKGSTLADIENTIKDHNEPLYYDGKLVGCVKKAHDVDINLNAHTILENLVVKASAVITAKHLLAQNLVDTDKIGYVIECSEEACGDVNQRGGGNFAKAIAESIGAKNSGGSDVRAFCAAPTHSLIHAASLVEAGTYDNVLVLAGGATAKLGMNGKSHVAKGEKILEDVLGGFAVLISKNDGVSPVIRTDIVGTHKVGTGGSPQKVTESLVLEPLRRNGLKISDVNKYSVEMQNKDITGLAGAGDVPLANYKMIAALAVMNKEIEKKDLLNFCTQIGMEGWAPTQGHIPSGVPYCGFVVEDLKKGSDLKRAMIIGKGSLFLGRMTNLFDGISFLIEQNDGSTGSSNSNSKNLPLERLLESVKVADLKVNKVTGKPVVGVTTLGSEHGEEMIIKAAEEAAKDGNFEVVLIGPKSASKLKQYEAKDEAEIAKVMEGLIDKGEINGCVTMHYNFEIGISTVGRVATPIENKPLLISTTTGTSDTDRTSAMLKNAVYGMITAKSMGIKKPTLGILNLDNARAVKRSLDTLKKNGYDFEYGKSNRADGGEIMRGNDLLSAPVDVIVTDSLTGNVLMKLFSSFNTVGKVEETGYGYGPGVGFTSSRLVNIISRASGQPVVSNAIRYCATLAEGNLIEKINSEKKLVLTAVESALTSASEALSEETTGSFEMPAKEVVTSEINGIDILDLDNAVEAILRKGVYAESGMGCTGPIVLVSPANLDKAKKILEDKQYI